MFKFTKATNNIRTISCQIKNAFKCPSDEDYALFFGKARTLFGEPDSVTDDYECMFSYDITATDETSGKSFYLEIYHGPSGSAIGGMPVSNLSDEDKKMYNMAADELIELINSAEPADYVWEGVYEDIPVNIKYIVKDGKATVESELPEGFDM